MRDTMWWLIHADSDDMKYPEDVITVLALQILTLKNYSKKNNLENVGETVVCGDIQMLLNQLDEIVERIKQNNGNCVLAISRSVFGNNAEQVIDFFTPTYCGKIYQSIHIN